MRLFFVLGLPRSKTAWASNLLTHGSSFCFHEASRQVGSMGELRQLMESVEGYDYVGNSDPNLCYLANEFLAEFGDETRVAIARPKIEVLRSLQAWAPGTKPVALTIAGSAGMRVITAMGSTPTIHFDDLGPDLEKTREFWEACGLPKDEWNELRARELSTLKVEVTPDRVCSPEAQRWIYSAIGGDHG